MKKSVIPAMFTLGNLGCGIISILMTFKGNYKYASVFILLGALLDRYDGRIARYLNSTSDMGKELDSLADLVSFGVAPSILMFNLFNFSSFGFISYILLLIFPICGSYRLAKYNVSSFNGIYTGIPITITGSLLAVYSFFTSYTLTTKTISIILILLLSYLMISKISIKKL